MEEKEERRTRTKQYGKGCRHEITKYLLTYGGITRKSFDLLDMNKRTKATTLKRMIDEGTISDIRFKDMNENYVVRANRLKDFDTKCSEYLSFYPYGYYKHYNECAKEVGYNLGRSVGDKVKCDRAKRICEGSMPFYVSKEIRDLPEDKKDILAGKEQMLPDASYYFITPELKNTDDTIDASRSIGMLVTPDEEYMVYYTASRRMKYSAVSELQATNDRKLFVQSHKGIKVTGTKRAIVIGEESGFKSMLKESDEKYFTMPSCFREVYQIPYSEFGIRLLDMMTKADWKESLKKKYLKGYAPPTLANGIAHDAKEGEKLVLLYCIPDLEKLWNFTRWSKNYADKSHFKIICFKEQAKFLKDICEETATIEIVK